MSELLTIEQEAPGFNAIDQNGLTVSLAEFLGNSHVVLYFYPKDDTPGCTVEANDFTALSAEFAALDTVVLGVSKDDCDSHCAFIAKYDLKVRLLADTDGSLCDQYGVWQWVEKDGVGKWKIVRSTFVIDKQGRLAAAQYLVDPVGHAQEVLALVKTLA